jgi:hypothetical protein
LIDENGQRVRVVIRNAKLKWFKKNFTAIEWATPDIPRINGGIVVGLFAHPVDQEQATTVLHHFPENFATGLFSIFQLHSGLSSTTKTVNIGKRANSTPRCL